MKEVNLLKKILLILLFFVFSSGMAADNRSDFNLEIKYGKEHRTLKDGFFLYEGRIYINENILSEFFKLTHSVNYYTNKYLVKGQSQFLQIPFDTDYVMTGGEIFRIKEPVLEREEGHYLSEAIFLRVLQKVLSARISLTRINLESENLLGELKKTLNLTKNLIKGEVLERIIIDPGHGGEDEGAVYGTFKEKDLALDIAKRLKAYIEANSKIEVFLTRKKDEFIPLKARTKKGNAVKGNLYVSIHMNAAKDSKSAGYEVYVSDPEVTDEAAALLAKVENSVLRFEDEDYGKSVLDEIFSDITSNSYKTDSLEFAEIVMRHNKVFKSRRIMQAPFAVLMGLNMPSILIEIGFLSNDKDRNKFKSDVQKQTMVKNIFHSIIEYKNKFDKKYKAPANFGDNLDKKLEEEDLEI
jgi:N-acetylmuramoyl-L-alanine amidase